MFTHYIKIAVRQLLKYKTQNAISIVGLSVALLCFSLCLYVTRYALDVNECFELKHRIVQFYSTNTRFGETHPRTVLFYDTADDVEKVNPAGLQCMTCMGDNDCYQYMVEIAPEKMVPYELTGYDTDSNFIRVFTPEILSGSWAQAASTPNSVVITESTAKRLFGSVHAAIGRKINRLQRAWYMMPDEWPEGGIFYTVQAVMDDIPENNTILFGRQLDFFCLNDECGFANAPKEWLHSSTWGFFFGLLDEQTDMDTFCEAFEESNCRTYITDDDYFSIYCAPMGENSYFNLYVEDYLIWIPFVAGMLVLLVGCLNFFHFLVGSQLTRMREYSISRVNGATGKNLVMQLMVQSSLMISISGMFAFIMAELLAPYLSFEVQHMNLDIGGAGLYLQMASYLLCLFLLAFIVSIAVVWHVHRLPIQDGIYGGSRKYGRKRLRNAMLCIQLLIAWLFVCVTVVYYRQAQKVEEKVLSFISPDDKERIISLSLLDQYTSVAEKQAIVDKIKTLTDAEDVITGCDLLQVVSTLLSTTETFTETSSISVNRFYFSLDAPEFIGMKIVKGTNWQKPGDILVDEKLARLLAEKSGEEVIGMKLYQWGAVEYTVVGICEEILLRTDEPMAGYYIDPVFPSEGVIENYCYVKCRKGCVESVQESIDNILSGFYPDSFEPECCTLSDKLRAKESEVFFIRDVAMFMSVIILVICLLGVYSAVTLDTEFRQKEMAIRKVNGATMKNIALLFARLYMVLLTVSFAVALPVVLKVVAHISSLYYIFIDTGVLFYVSIFFFLSLVVALTVGWKIWRISKVNPATVIRKE